MGDLGFHREMLSAAVKEDSLMVSAKGLGNMVVIVKLLQYYCNQVDEAIKRKQQKRVVFVIGLSEEGERVRDLVGVTGGFESTCTPPVVITNKFTSQDRKKMYSTGGCFIITSRILVVDLLTETVDFKDILGVMVDKAHQLRESTNETFALNILRSSSTFKGFVKAFSDAPEALTSQFGFLSHIMSVLQVEKVHLWPRFHAVVRTDLDKNKPEVVEISQPLSNAMSGIQSEIVAALEMCLSELKRVQHIDVSSLTVENGLFKSFEITLRRQLDPIWHKIGKKTKQLVADVGVLRRLLPDLLRYDAASFLRVLENVHAEARTDQNGASLWLLTDAADRMFQLAKKRVFKISKKGRVKKVEDRIKAFNPSSLDSVVVDEDGCLMKMKITMNENPKVGLLRDVVNELSKENRPSMESVFSQAGVQTIVFVHDDLSKNELYHSLYEHHHKVLAWEHHLQDYLFHRFKAFCEGHALQSYLASHKDVSDESWVKLLEALYLGELKQQQAPDGKEITTQLKLGAEQRLLLCEYIQRQRRLRLKKDYDDKHETVHPPQPTGDVLWNNDFRGRVMIYTVTSENSVASILEETCPKFVIMYDPDVRTVRQVEVFKARHLDLSLRLYFLQYQESVEEQKYLSDLMREQDTFRKLIEEKAGLVLAGSNPIASGTALQDEKRIQENKIVGYNISTGQPILASSLTGQVITKKKVTTIPSVVVDMREFRSALPVMLHKHGVLIKPATLEVGDYILSPEICIERKSIPDLHGSFNSGRLFTQAEAMCRFYKRPHLLIEFDENKPFSLLSAVDMTGEISHSSISSKLVLLAKHFPSLKLLWSPSPSATVDLFKLMKVNYNNPDPEFAAKVGIPEDNETEQQEQQPQQQQQGSDEENVSAKEFLRRLPGITIYNYVKVMANVSNLRELSNMDESAMIKLLGRVNGKKLYGFFHQRPDGKEAVDLGNEIIINEDDEDDE